MITFPGHVPFKSWIKFQNNIYLLIFIQLSSELMWAPLTQTQKQLKEQVYRAEFQKIWMQTLSSVTLFPSKRITLTNLKDLNKKSEAFLSTFQFLFVDDKICFKHG